MTGRLLNGMPTRSASTLSSRMQDEWKKQREMLPPFQGGPQATQDSSMDIEEVEQVVVPQAEVCGASSEAPSVVSSVHKVSVMIL